MMNGPTELPINLSGQLQGISMLGFFIEEIPSVDTNLHSA
jgi:hypothetical protein